MRPNLAEVLILRKLLKKPSSSYGYRNSNRKTNERLKVAVFEKVTWDICFMDGSNFNPVLHGRIFPLVVVVDKRGLSSAKLSQQSTRFWVQWSYFFGLNCWLLFCWIVELLIVDLLNCWMVKLLKGWIVELLRRWIVEALDCWIVELLNCWIVEVLKCWNAELINCWMVELLNCWIVELLNCWIVESLNC